MSGGTLLGWLDLARRRRGCLSAGVGEGHGVARTVGEGVAGADPCQRQRGGGVEGDHQEGGRGPRASPSADTGERGWGYVGVKPILAMPTVCWAPRLTGVNASSLKKMRVLSHFSAGP